MQGGPHDVPQDTMHGRTQCPDEIIGTTIGAYNYIHCTYIHSFQFSRFMRILFKQMLTQIAGLAVSCYLNSKVCQH